MSEPRTIKAYLAALNAALEVGLRSRHRILAEVEDHLLAAADEQLRRGVGSAEAQWRAVIAFGRVEQVAARFDAGLIGTLDRRLALSVRWMHHSMTQRRWGVPALIVGLSILVGGAFAAFAVAFDRDPLLAAGAYVGGGAVALYCVFSSGLRQHLRDMTNNSCAGIVVPSFFAYPAVVSCLVLLSGVYAFDGVAWFGGFTIVDVGWFGSEAVIGRAMSRTARRYSGTSEQDRQRAWSADHPWRWAVARVAPLPLGLITLIAVYPAPATGALRVGLVAVVGVMTAVAAGAVRLESARRERDAVQRMLMSESNSRTTSWRSSPTRWIGSSRGRSL